MATVTTNQPVLERHITAEVRPVLQASRSAFVALLQRDLTVLRKNIGEFVTRTLVQPTNPYQSINTKRAARARERRRRQHQP